MNYKDITRKNTIPCDFWVQLADRDWNEGDPIKGVLHVEPSKLHEFFAACRGVTEKVIVISAASDFSVCDLKIRHPNFDFSKLLLQGWHQTRVVQTSELMQGIIRPPVNPNKFKQTDKYSVKIDRWSELSFSEIPGCVAHWFCANLDTSSIPRTTALPFGLAPSHDPKQSNLHFEYYRHDWLGRSLYVNFSPNTGERIELLKHYARRPNVTVEPEANLSAERYVDRLTRHGAVLCPEGNGLDSYRVAESLYCGRVPVMKDCGLVRNLTLSGLPIFGTASLFDIDEKALWDFVESDPFRNADLTVLTQSFWREIIGNWRDALNQLGDSR